MKFIGLIIVTVVSCHRRQLPPFTYGKHTDISDDLIRFLGYQNATYLRTVFNENYLLDGDTGDNDGDDSGTCEIGDNLPSIGEPGFTDGVFKCLMLQKCSIKPRKFRQLEKYHAANGIVNSLCMKQLEQFNRDLVDGQFHAQQMCDAWGEDVDFRSWPGLQEKITQISLSTYCFSG